MAKTKTKPAATTRNIKSSGASGTTASASSTARTDLLPSTRSWTRKNLFAECIQDDQIYIFDNVLTHAECDALIADAEALGFAPAEKSLRPRKGFAFRDSGRISLLDAPTIADRLWTATGLDRAVRAALDDDIADAVPVALNPHIRLYRYVKGQSFGQHYDESVVTSKGPTAFTLLVYLSDAESDGLVGGETVFYEGKRKVVYSYTPRKGSVLLHRHGDECLLHEAAAVQKGAKYIMRSDVVFGPRPAGADDDDAAQW
ncbi:hypothetical protein GGF31_001127 [Allomyces arbusculus]|nr:hypothetical protein GGF31_001127 [Allomyces arbusculus]